jgi:hypothetical protein
MKSGIYDITIENGSTYQVNIAINENDGTAYDLTTYTPTMQIRTRSDALILDCSSYLSISNGNEINLNIPSSVTKDLKYALGEYQILVTTGAVAFSILRGKVEFTKAVTR